MAMLGPVPALELVAGLAEGQEWGQGAHAEKAYLVDWPSRFAAAHAILGLVSYSAGTGGSLRIDAPGQYPESPNLLARQVAIHGMGTWTQGPKQVAFEKAAIVVSYGVPTWEPVAQPEQNFDPTAPLVYATQSIKFAGQFITVPSKKLKTLGGSNLDKDFGRFVGINQMSLTLYQMPFLVTYSMRQLIGQMNNAPIFGCPTGTLQLTGIDTQRAAAVDGTVTQETTFAFAERPEAAWDMEFTGAAINNGWEHVVTQDGNPVILSGDFTQLIPLFYRS
jgi:hypothetical protein